MLKFLDEVEKQRWGWDEAEALRVLATVPYIDDAHPDHQPHSFPFLPIRANNP